MYRVLILNDWFVYITKSSWYFTYFSLPKILRLFTFYVDKSLIYLVYIYSKPPPTSPFVTIWLREKNAHWTVVRGYPIPGLYLLRCKCYLIVFFINFNIHYTIIFVFLYLKYIFFKVSLCDGQYSSAKWEYWFICSFMWILASTLVFIHDLLRPPSTPQYWPDSYTCN